LFLFCKQHGRNFASQKRTTSRKDWLLKWEADYKQAEKERLYFKYAFELFQQRVLLKHPYRILPTVQVLQKGRSIFISRTNMT
jgi:hypothetical protein